MRCLISALLIGFAVTLAAARHAAGGGAQVSAGHVANSPAELRFVRFEITLPSPGDHRIVISNLRGETVKVLADEFLPGGRVAFRWNGNNDQGISQPTGLYWVRIDGVQVGSVGLVR